MAGRKRLREGSMSYQEEVRRTETKYASLYEDYVELQRCVMAWRKRVRRSRNKLKRLREEVNFLRGKYKMLTEKNPEEPVNPSVFPEFGTKALSIYRKPEEPTEVLAIKDELVRCELTELQTLMSTDHHTSAEMTGQQLLPMRIMPAFTVHPNSTVTATVKQSHKKRDLENNRLVSAKKPSKVKDGPKKKSKADLLVPPEYNGKSITIFKKPKEPAEAMTIEDKSGRHDLTRMQTFSSTDDCTLPEIPSAMSIMSGLKVPHSSLVTPAVIESRNEKIKADRLASTEVRAQIISICKRPKEPTKRLVIADKPAKHELTEMTGLQPSAITSTPSFKVPHSPLVTPIVEPANKKRRLENNGLTVASAQNPSKVKDGRNRKIRADPLVSPGSVARNISILRRPEEPTEALTIESKPARYELPGMQRLLLTDDCTLPEMASATSMMTAFTVPHRSLATPIVEPANEKRHLKNNGPVHAEKPSNVKDGQNKKSKGIPVKSMPLFEERDGRSFSDN